MTEEIQEAKKKLKHQSKNLSVFKLIMTDIISMIFALGPGLSAWFSAALIFKMIFDSMGIYLAIISVPFTIVIIFLVATRFLRLFIPKMKPGLYRLGFNKGFRAWYFTLCLGHSVRIFGMTSFFFTFYITKYLYWRAMGANIAYGVNSSLFLTMVDYPLITIKKGCSFGAYTHIACHTFVGDKLFLAPVVIEEDVYIGMNNIIGPKTKIKKGTWTGFNNRFFQVTIPEYTHIDNFAWEYGKPEKSSK